MLHGKGRLLDGFVIVVDHAHVLKDWIDLDKDNAGRPLVVVFV